MFKKFTNGCVRVVNRWLPDAFLFAIILSIIVFIGSMCATKMGPLQVLNAWGDSKGFWGLLSFSMQMALVLVFGSAMAAAKPCKKALRAAAGLCHNNMQAIVVTTFISTLCCWLNWGFGLIAGTLLAKEVVRRVPTVDYPLLIASAYSGFVIWHAGLSGSIPLDLVAGKKFGEVLYQAPITDTVFHPMNLIMVGVILFVMPLVNYAMHPDKAHTVCIDPTLLEDEAERTYEVRTPADKLEHSKLLWAITLVGGFVYIIYYFVQYDRGILNEILGWFGRAPVDWLADAGRARFIITIMNSWQYCGTSMVMYLAGLQSIPALYYEAADIDGASTFEKFRYVTLPLLIPAIASAVIINLIGSLKLNDIIISLTNGGPAQQTHSLSTYISYVYFRIEKAGYASAIGVFMFVFILIVTIIANRYFRSKEVEY